MTFSKKTTLLSFTALVTMLFVSCKSAEDKGSISSTFYVDSIKASEVATLEFNSWGYPKKKLFNFVACVKDKALMAPITEQAFSVSDEQTSKAQKTDSRGCFNWSESHDFDFFAPEAFIEIKRNISALGNHTGSIDLALAINPWRDGASSVIDLRYDRVVQLSKAVENSFDKPLSTSNKTSSTAEAAKLDLKSLRIQFMGQDYEHYSINPGLTLNIAHSVRVRLQPSIIRKTINRKDVVENPNSGRVHVTAVFLKDLNESGDAAFDPKNFVTAIEQDMEIGAGGIVEDLVLKFSDASAVASRMQLLVQVVPCEDAQSIASVMGIGPIGPMPSILELGPNLLPTKVSAVAVLQKYRAQQAEIKKRERSPLQLFSLVSGYRALNSPEFVEGSKLSANSLVPYNTALKYMSGSATPPDMQKLYEALCYKFYARQNSLTPPSGVSKSAASAWDKFKTWVSSSEMLADAGAAIGLTRTNDLSKIEPEKALGYCLMHPEQVLYLSARDLVVRILNEKPRRAGVAQIEKLTVTSSMTRTETKSKTIGTSTKFNMGGNINAGVSATVGASYGGEYNADNTRDYAAERKKAADDAAKAAADAAKANGQPVPVTPPPSPWKEGEKTATKWGGKAGVDARAGIEGKISLGKDWYWTSAQDSKSDTTKSVSASRQMILTSEANPFEIEVESKRCLLMKPALETANTADRQGFYLCSRQNQKEVRTEVYYLITSQNGLNGSPLADNDDFSNNPWRMLIRGSQTYNMFKDMVSDATLNLNLEKIDDATESMIPNQLDFRVTQEFPGLLSLQP